MLFTGGSKPTKTFARRSRARYLKPTADGKFIDETEVSRAAREAERMAEASKKTKRTASRKGKQSQPNYKSMESLQYATIRQTNYYDEADSDGPLEDSMFWNSHFRAIHDDVYATLKLRPMHPINLTEAQSKSRLIEALDVTNKMGLHHLMTIQCNYDSSVVRQFFSTLVLLR